MRDATGGAGRVTIVGAGPAGLFLARTIGLRSPGTVVDVYERLEPGADTGFGVSLSARTLRTLAGHDPGIHRRIIDAGVAQRGIEVRLPSGSLRYNGFEVSAVSRSALLGVLRDGAREAGARLHYGRRLAPGEACGDVIAVADGAASVHRDALREAFGTTTQMGESRYIWLGTPTDVGDAAVMAFARTDAGPMAAHLYAYGGGMSTVVVEMDDRTWRRAGLADAVRPGGDIDDAALKLLAEVFAAPLAGRPLVSAASRWRRFTVVRNEHWSHGRTVLLGDAAHTAHFTVGSGTKLALEDALELGIAMAGQDGTDAAFATYERLRRGAVARTQRWAEPSMRWWETYGRRMRLPVEQFGLHFMTRTPAMTYDALRRRCPERLAEAEAAFHRSAGDTDGAHGTAVTAPLTVAGVRFPGRRARLTAAGPVPRAGLLRPAGDGLLVVDAAAGSGVSYLALPCPAGPPGDDVLVERAAAVLRGGVPAVLVQADVEAAGWWHHTLRHADRIRTETGAVTGVIVPADRTAGPWPQRIQLALVAGRADFVVCVALTAAQCERAGDPD